MQADFRPQDARRAQIGHLQQLWIDAIGVKGFTAWKSQNMCFVRPVTQYLCVILLDPNDLCTVASHDLKRAHFKRFKVYKVRKVRVFHP